MHNYIGWFLAHPKRTALLLGALVLVWSYYGLSVTMDNRMEVWLPEHSAARMQYRKFLASFGSEEFILVALQPPAGLTRDHLRMTQSLTLALEQVAGIKKVWSITSIFDKPLKNYTLVKKIILKSSFCRNTLIAQDGKTTGILLLLSQEGLKNRIALVNKVKEIVSSATAGKTKAFLAGPPVINVALDQMSQRVSARYAPILFFVCLMVLILFFKSVAGVVVPALMMGSSLLLTIGWMGLGNVSLNTITVACFPLIMVISLAYALYFYSAYQKSFNEKGCESLNDQRKSAVINACNSVCFPVFLSALTTAAGFGSLMVSDIPPVRHLGLFVALGTLSTFFCALTLLPSLLLLFPAPSPLRARDLIQEKLQRALQLVGEFAIRAKMTIIIFCAGLLVVAIAGIMRLSVETHILNFFKKNSLLVKTYNFIEQNFTGLSPIEIVIESKQKPGKDALLARETLNKIKALQAFLEQQPGVVGTQSIRNIIEDKTRADFWEMPFVSKEPLFAALDAAAKEFFSEQGTATRVSVKAQTLGSDAYLALINNINQYLASHFRDGYSAYTTGIVTVIVDMQDTLVKNLIKSFTIALGVICFIFLLLFRSLKNTVISMIPNLLPIAVILGFMGWWHIKLDVATVMIASIAIGIAVDDTIHFLVRFRQQKQLPGDYVRPIMATILSTGKPIVFTSVVTLCGFLVLCFSDFKPMSYFGLLTGVTIVAALLGDLIMLPALLVAFKVKFH